MIQDDNFLPLLGSCNAIALDEVWRPRPVTSFTSPVARRSSPNNLFTKDFVIECKTKVIKFTLKGLSDAWKALNETQKNKYIKEFI